MFKIDENMLKAIKGSSERNKLSEAKVELALVQAASILTLEGITRASATEVMNRAVAKYGIEATPSFTGQVFASYGIQTVVSHGKSRFVLDRKQLEEIKKGIEARCEETAAKLEKTIKEFDTLPQRIDELNRQWQGILELRKEERELLNTIIEEKKKPSRMGELRAEMQQINEEKAQLDQEAARLESLKDECKELNQQLKKLPSFEKKKADLEARIAEHRQKLNEVETAEAQVSRQETALAERINRLKPRKGWVQLADLYKAIEEAEQELKEISKQLGEKKSLLERMGLKKR